MNFARLNTLYWTKELANTNHDTGKLIDADLNETFTANLLEQASDWVVAVERFEVSCNAVPYYDGAFNQESWDLYNIGDDWDDPLVAPVQQMNIAGLVSYSLHDTIQQLDDLFGAAGGFIGAGNYSIRIDNEGIVTLDRTNQAAYKSKIPAKLNYILGLHDEVADNEWKSAYPRIGCGDELDHIRISSNLDLISDTIGQAKTNIVTDLSISASISSNANSFSWSPRDKVIYNAAERRYLIFNSSAPVQVIRLFVEYVQPDGTERKLQLPVGGVFNVKLGFYQRV
jgi:hypothetical protein